MSDNPTNPEPERPPGEEAASNRASPRKGDLLGNTLILVVAQFAGTPLSILSATMMGRFLGPKALGFNYLGTALAQFAFLFVEWGVSGVLPAAISKDRSRAGVLVGSALAWKAIAAPILTLALALLGAGLDQEQQLIFVFLLVSLHTWFGSASLTMQDAVRGFERTDVTAYGQIGSQFLSAVLVIGTLVLGGNLYAVLGAQVFTNVIVFWIIWFFAKRIIAEPITVARNEVVAFLKQGTPFLIVALTNSLQGSIDAAYLSQLAPPDVVGWHAAARRLIGVLLMPAVALITSLYPTLSRLHHEDLDQYQQLVAKSVKGTAILAMPIALCCGVYRNVGVALYGKSGFARSEENLLVMSAFVFLVYFSMPLGSAILAAGRQRAWAWVQLICVLVSLALDPLLVPWFGQHYGNGGLGICVATVISEIPVVFGGVLLLPKGSLGRPVAASLLRVSLAGATFIAVAYGLRAISPYLAAPMALASYVATLWVVGPEERGQMRSAANRVLGKFASKLSRAK